MDKILPKTLHISNNNRNFTASLHKLPNNRTEEKEIQNDAVRHSSCTRTTFKRLFVRLRNCNRRINKSLSYYQDVHHRTTKEKKNVRNEGLVGEKKNVWEEE